MRSQSASYHGYRFLPDIISHAVWLYHRFCLSFRDAEDLLAQRGVTVTYETIRQWCQRFGPVYARRLRRRHARVNAGGSLEPAPLSRVASGRAVVAGRCRSRRLALEAFVMAFTEASSALNNSKTALSTLGGRRHPWAFSRFA